MTLLDPKLDSLKYEMEEESRPAGTIKVVGVGGGGSNAVAHMMGAGMNGVEFYAINTDVQALQACPVPNKLAIGRKVTHGRGAGADPETGRQAALEDTERILEILQGAELVFVAAGLGSGTGTGASPVVASMAKELNALTVAVVTTPFEFEGARRQRHAEAGLKQLAESVDTFITVPNERLLALAPRGTSILDAFRMAHEFIRQIVQDLCEMITTPGFINRDFADVRTALLGMGYSVLGTAVARGENAAVEAAQQAIQFPLIGNGGIRGARNILLNMMGSSGVGLHEVNDACQMVRKATGCEDVQLNFGIVLDESMDDAVKVTIIATGFGERDDIQPAIAATAGATQWLSEAQPVAAAAPAPVSAVHVQAAAVKAAPEPTADAKPANGTPLPEFEDELDMPAILRQQRVQ